MDVGNIPGATRDLAKPENWDDSMGECGSLPVKDYERAPGLNAMASLWIPSKGDLEYLNKGAGIVLTVVGSVHPPVSVHVEKFNE